MQRRILFRFLLEEKSGGGRGTGKKRGEVYFAGRGYCNSIAFFG